MKNSEVYAIMLHLPLLIKTSTKCVQVWVCVCAHVSVCECVCACTQERTGAQSYLTLCDFMDCSLPGSPVHGISEAIILAWVAISYFTASSRPRDRTCVSVISCIGRWVLYHCVTWEAQSLSTRMEIFNILTCE